MRSRAWFWIAWVLIALAAAWLYGAYRSPGNYVGIVEALRHNVSAQLPGTLIELRVDIGDRVEAGQLLGRVQGMDALLADGLRVRSDLFTLQSRLRDELSGLAADEAESSALNSEIKRLEQARDAGVVRSSELTQLRLRRAALRAKVARQRTLLAQQTGEQAPVELQQGLDQLLAAPDSGALLSPCAGVVVERFAATGDTVDAFIPLLIVQQLETTHVNAYVPEQNNLPMVRGARVMVGSKRPGIVETGGTIVFVHPGFTLLPLRLLIGQQQTWARQVYVELDQGHALLPGEQVRVVLIDKPEQ
ncbi:MAG: hypothetical protein P9M14_03705 [Candidatus Alcyoniella australis]|nr:hypothetical protein [Candidatus Alcyoniella australis]